MRYKLGFFYFHLYQDSFTTPEDGWPRLIAYITTRRMGMSVANLGSSTQEMGTPGVFNFSYRLGIPSTIYQLLCHLLKSLQSHLESKSTELIESGNVTETPGENGVQQRIVDYLDKQWSLFNVKFLS